MGYHWLRNNSPTWCDNVLCIVHCNVVLDWIREIPKIGSLAARNDRVATFWSF